MKFSKQFVPISKISLGIIFLCFCYLSKGAMAASTDKLIFAIDVIRHGDRTPASDMPTAPHVWSEGLGQLTGIGMKQEHALGLKLHDRYIGKLLPTSYQAGIMYVRSSDYDRTLMSAQAILLGFYSLGTGPLIQIQDAQVTDALPNGFQPIPVHTIPKHQEPLLICDDEKNIVLNYSFQDLLKSNLYPTKEWQAKEKQLQPYFAAWSQATGIPITCLYDLKPLTDILSIERLKGIELPPGLSEEDATTIIDAGHWAMLTAFKNPVIGKTTGAALLQEISNYLKNAAKNSEEHPDPLKYVLFSAHDITLLSVMSAMGVPLNEMPPYSSDLNICLTSQGNNNYYVTATYNDKPLIFPCSGSTICTLDQFASAYGALGK